MAEILPARKEGIKLKNKNAKTIKKDKVFEEVQDISKKDNEIMAPALEKILKVISDELDADNEFTVRQGYIALSKALVYISQALCENEEFFKKEIDAAQKIALEKIIPSMLPLIKDGKIVDENYDKEDLSVRRMMMALAQAGEYIIWRMLVSNIQDIEKEDNSKVETENKEKQ
ncbi:hypothetical protein [Clostridium saccharoperbutylacetonicum]|uniref:Uncharacterized protein n=1 Tax=Clostridium saccharoperbutylacetonicum N1-4(HMT) TaxID=931276 RepID=M1N8K7_9CLOT|nr:hypothetical protein [Clostridium saccharoperbutylacetonicum]AGF59657.1 hypothetical protein Cspa_135p00970 [Clostridium saccharoperbutylacetonicum N1-4(HMT)]